MVSLALSHCVWMFVVFIYVHTISRPVFSLDILRGNQTTPVASILSPQCFTNGKPFADVIAPVFKLPLSADADKHCEITSFARDKILIRMNSNVLRCAMASIYTQCAVVGCAGIIVYVDSNPSASDWFAQRVRLPFAAPVPVVAVSQLRQNADLLESKTFATDFRVRLRYGEHNEFQDVSESYLFRVYGSMGIALILANVAFALYKLFAYIRAGFFRTLNTMVLFVLMPEIILNFLKSLVFECFTFFTLTWDISFFPFLRLMLSVPEALDIATSATIASIFFDNISQTKGSPTQTVNRILRASTVTVFISVLVDITNSSISGLYGEIISAKLIATVYILWQVSFDLDHDTFFFIIVVYS